MQRNVIIVVLLCVIFQCNGHLPSLTDILSGAHKRVHHAAHGVANTVLGGLNFEGHVQVDGHSHPQPPRPNEGKTETIIVIVDESPDDTYGPGPQNLPNHGHGYNNRPHHPHGHHNYGQHPHGHNNYEQHPHGHNNYGQHPHGHNYYEQGRPWQNQNSNYNNANSNEPHGHHHSHYEQNPNNYNNQNGNQNQYANQNEYLRPEQTTQRHGNSNNNRPFDQSPGSIGNTNQNNYGQTQSPPTAETRPTFASIRENEAHTEKPSQDIKKTTESDFPEFVALNPNEYVYGGEKIDITAPKRETVSDDDEDSLIDPRFQGN